MIEMPKSGQLWENRFEIKEQIGAGGIGTVFKAHQVDANRTVALKILHPVFSEDDEFKERFLREAQSLNSLSHLNVVKVFLIALSSDGLPYIVMELVRGKSLRSLILDGPVQATLALKIIHDLAETLCFVHSHGITHRDLKPENVLLVDTPEPNTVKLIDFGLIKFSDKTKQKLTSTGLLIGSPSYMSPEQCLGKEVDARSDIYSLCICAFELLSGSLPFGADNAIGVMYKHMNAPIPVLNGKDNSANQLNRVLSRGLAKDPANRYQTMQELVEEIEQIPADNDSSYSYKGSSGEILSEEEKTFPIPELAIALMLMLFISIACSLVYPIPAGSSTDSGVVIFILSIFLCLPALLGSFLGIPRNGLNYLACVCCLALGTVLPWVPIVLWIYVWVRLCQGVSLRNKQAKEVVEEILDPVLKSKGVDAYFSKMESIRNRRGLHYPTLKVFARSNYLQWKNKQISG